jgi:TetR/AcrR family transcriptional regulator, cholesterol catabolism regulator
VPESRRARKKDRTRSGIFRAALDLFASRGFEAVTVEQICSSADVARGTFFLHFPSKVALLEEWNRELAAELAERLHDPGDSALLQYRTLVEQLSEQWQRRPDAIRSLLYALLAPRANGERAPERDLRALVERVVERGQARGEFRRNVSARLAAAAFLATCAAAFAATEPGGSPAAQRNELLHALLHGLSEPKPRLKWAPAP